MILNSNVTENKLDEAIKYTSYVHVKPMKAILIIVSITMSGALEYSEYLTNSSFSITRFALCSVYISAFLLLLYCVANKASLSSGVLNVTNIMEGLLKDDWSYPFYNIKNINPLLIKHPVFRSIIGLYVFRYGRAKEGSDLINKAASELPCINNAIEDGKVKDKNKFNDLKQVIINDLYPDTFVKTFDLVSIFTMLAALVLIIFKLLKVFIVH